jgi:hypothetical protein
VPTAIDLLKRPPLNGISGKSFAPQIAN